MEVEKKATNEEYDPFNNDSSDEEQVKPTQQRVQPQNQTPVIQRNNFPTQAGFAPSQNFQGGIPQYNQYYHQQKQQIPVQSHHQHFHQQQSVQTQNSANVASKKEEKVETNSNGLRTIGPWTEHKLDDGKIFYHNKETNKSVWEKPDVFKDEKEKLLDSCIWTAFTTDDGKEYYHNGKTNETQWEMPDEYKAHLARKEIDRKLEGDGADLSREERIQLFVLALKKAGVTVQMNQEDAFNAVHSLKEWNLLKFSEKRAAYNTYIADLKSQEQKEIRKKEQLIADEFIQVLFDCDKITKDTKFRDAMGYIATSPKFQTVSSNAERERLFYVFLKKKEEKLQEEERRKKKEARDAFQAVLESSFITLDTLWRDFKEIKKDEPVFNIISHLDALELFQSYLKDIERKEEEALKNKERELQRRSRKARDQFRILLDEEFQKGEITRKSYWSTFKGRISKDERYLTLADPDLEGSTPAELFYDLTMHLEDKFSQDKKRVKTILKEINMIIDPTVKMDTFISKIIEHRNYENIDEANVEPIFHELQEKSIKEAEKIRSSAKKRFQELLMDSSITKDTTWETFWSALFKSDVGVLPLSEEEQIALFETEMKFRNDENNFQDKIAVVSAPKKERKDEKEKKRDDRKKKDKYRDDSYESRSQSRSPSPSRQKRRRSENEDKRDNQKSKRDRRD